MQTFQTALDIAALIPPAIAVLLFLEYAWKRSAPNQATLPHPDNVDEPESILDIIDPYGILEDLPAAGPEDCEPTRTTETLSLIESKFAEADNLSQMREAMPGGGSAQFAALVMPSTAQTTVEVEQVSDPRYSFESPFDPNAMTSHRLRKECQKLKIKWRNAHGKGKHLTRDEMLERIGQAIA